MICNKLFRKSKPRARVTLSIPNYKEGSKQLEYKYGQAT